MATGESLRTDAQVRREGFHALLDRLGPADALRFLMQYESGSGDYTRDRHQWLDDISLEQAIERIRGRQESNEASG